VFFWFGWDFDSYLNLNLKNCKCKDHFSKVKNGGKRRDVRGV
jgi:hypothetical protein